jgi:hypothetical protein
LFGVVDPSSHSINCKILTRSFQAGDLRRDQADMKMPARGAGILISDRREPFRDQFRTVMQEMSERFSVLHTASA